MESQVEPAADFWAGRSVLVTGANGFVGSWLTAALVSGGAHVTALVRDQTPHGGLRLVSLERSVNLVTGSVVDRAVVERAIQQYEIQHCFHLAAQALVGSARSLPDEAFDSNVRGTWVVLDACRRTKVESVVVASSDKAYGPSDDLPYKETHPLRAAAVYEASKACADIVARSFHASFALPVAVTRCANIYGGGDMNPSRLIPETVKAALEGRPPVLRSDGTHLRDFLFVGDAVNAYLVLARRVAAGDAGGQAYNFGGGAAHRVIDLVRRILELAGRPDLEPVIQARVSAGEEIAAQYVDSSRARHELGWEPMTSLDEGLRRTVAWFAAHRREAVGIS